MVAFDRRAILRRRRDGARRRCTVMSGLKGVAGYDLPQIALEVVADHDDGGVSKFAREIGVTIDSPPLTQLKQLDAVGHTLQTVIPDMEKLVDNIIQRLLLDKGYRGHNAPPDYKFRVFISGQKRGVTPSIKRTMRRRSAIEPVIGHLKAEHRMERNYLWFKQGDANNAILAAAGYNFRRLLRWLRPLLHQILLAFVQPLLNPT